VSALGDCVKANAARMTRLDHISSQGVLIMWPHLVHLFARIFHGMPLLVSSNWASWLILLGSFLLTELLLFGREGRHVAEWWKKRWSNLVIGLIVTVIVYAGLFAWSTIQTVYDDHHDDIGRWHAVVNEKNLLKSELNKRDEYIRKLENAKCPQCGREVGIRPEEKINSLTVEARMTCTIKPDVALPPSTQDIMAGFGTGGIVGPAGSVELARTNPVEFLKQRGNEMVVINHFYLPNSESLIGNPVSRIVNFDKLIVPITVLGSAEAFDRIKLVEVTVTINNKHTWYYPYRVGDIPFQAGLTVTIPLSGIEKALH
jgi:hypothetical protein